MGNVVYQTPHCVTRGAALKTACGGNGERTKSAQSPAKEERK